MSATKADSVIDPQSLIGSVLVCLKDGRRARVVGVDPDRASMSLWGQAVVIEYMSGERKGHRRELCLRTLLNNWTPARS